MSSHFYLYCEETDECVETVAHVGDKTCPRIDANALGAFLTYHLREAPAAAFRLVEVESFSDDRTCHSLAELAEDMESIGSFAGYRRPTLVWDGCNYREFASRRQDLGESLRDFEQNAGLWELKRPT